MKIISLIRKFGFKWRVIAKEFESRSDNHIKNRFYSHILKKVVKLSPVKYGDILKMIEKRKSESEGE